MKHKAQISSLDLLVSLIIFTFLILLFLHYFLSVLSFGFSPYVQMSDKGRKAAFILFHTPGIPSNWTSSSVVRAGVASESNVINYYKLEQLLDVSDDNFSSVIGIPQYDTYFRLIYYNNSPVYVGGKVAVKGNAPINQSSEVSFVVPMIFEEKPCKALLKIYTVS